MRNSAPANKRRAVMSGTTAETAAPLVDVASVATTIEETGARKSEHKSGARQDSASISLRSVCGSTVQRSSLCVNIVLREEFALLFRTFSSVSFRLHSQGPCPFSHRLRR